MTWRQGWQVFVRIRLVFLSAIEIRNPVKILCRFFLLPDIRNKHGRLCMRRGHHRLEQRARVYPIRQLDFYRQKEASVREVSCAFLTAHFFQKRRKKKRNLWIFQNFSRWRLSPMNRQIPDTVLLCGEWLWRMAVCPFFAWLFPKRLKS